MSTIPLAMILPTGWRAALLLVWCVLATGVLAAGEAHPLNRTGVKPRVVEGTGTDRSVFLGGQFIEVGIHNVGSFGASALPPTGFHPTTTYLGFVVDGDGFDTGSQPVVGDFFVPGSPEEVWGVEWTSGGEPMVLMNAGLVGDRNITPEDGYPNDVSLEDDRRSVWRGVAVSSANAAEQVTITQTVSFRRTDKFFVMNVVLNNTGKTTISGLKYLRSVDPDQESSSLVATPTSDTENFVVFQPPRGQLAAFPAGNTDRALVIGRGISTKVPVGLGAIDGRARVSHGGFTVRSASAVLDLGVADSQLSDSGRDATPSVNDEAISLAFDLGHLAPGQSVSIDYAYILDAADLDVALGQLARVTILQPTGTVSGSNAVFQVSTDNPDSATVKVDFYVAGVLVGTDNEVSRTGTFEVTFDTLTLAGGEPLPNGPVTIEAVATFADTTTSRKSATVFVDNAGPPIAFGGQTPANDTVVSGSQTPIEVVGTDAQNPPFQVTIFREALGTSILLATLSQPPYVATLDVSDLADGTVVVVKAVASDQAGATSTTILRSFTTSVNPPGQPTTVTAPTLPLSQGDQTIYVAVSPGTPQGRTSLLAALTGTDPTLTRAFTWDATIDSYVERPSSPTGGVLVSTGIFIATRVPLSYNLDGTSTLAPFTLTLPPAGWVFAGVPPLDDGEGVQTDFAWGDTQVLLDGEVALNDTSSPTIAEAMGNPATPTDSSSARPWFWNGSAYAQVDALESGKAYWFKNNTDQTISLTFGASVAALRAAKTDGARSANRQVVVRNQGTPPPPPSSSNTASSSSSGGCGAGSGVAAFALLMLMASLRLLIARR